MPKPDFKNMGSDADFARAMFNLGLERAAEIAEEQLGNWSPIPATPGYTVARRAAKAMFCAAIIEDGFDHETSCRHRAAEDELETSHG